MGSKVTLIHKTPNTVIIKTSGVGGGDGAATWGSISGTITNQTDLVNYIDAEIGAIPPPVIPTPPTPTLQSVTDEGNTTTNAINASGFTVEGAQNYDMTLRSEENTGVVIESPREVFINTGRSTYFNTDTDGGAWGDRQWIFGSSRQYSTGGRTYFKIGNLSGYPFLSLNNHDNNEQVRFDSNGNSYINGGNVGIGTTAPTRKLHVEGTSIIKAGTEGIDNPVLLVQNTIPYQSPFNQYLQVWKNSAGSNAAHLRADGSFNISAGSVAKSFNATQASTLSSIPFRASSSGTTGMYFPSAGVIGFANLASESMRITSDGNVGIGTTAPSPTAGTKGLHLVAPSNQSSEIKLDTTDSDRGTYLTFAKSGISKWDIYSPADNSLRFRELQVPSTTALTLLDGGNVGIGTTAPSQPLHIATNNNNTSLALRISNDHIAGRAGVTFGLPNQSNENYSIGVDNDRYFKISNGGNLATNTRLVIAPLGNVGIGTTAPDDRLTIAGGNVSTKHIGYATDALKITHNSNDVLLSLYKRSSQSSPDVQIRTNGNSYINGGNVGIGTTSPSDYYSNKLVVSAPDENGITIVADNTSAVNHIMFADGTIGSETYRGYLSYNHLEDSMRFGVSATERMRVTSNGNVGIGTTAPTFGLEIHKSGDAFRVANGGGYRMFSVQQVADQSSSYTTSVDGNSQIYANFSSTYNYQNFSALYARGFKASGANNAVGIRGIRAEHGFGYGAEGSLEYSRGVESRFSTLSLGTGTINNIYGFYNSAANSGVTINNQYGLYLSDTPVATNNYGVYQAGSTFKNVFEGNVGIGTTAPALQSGGTGLHINAPTSSEIKFTNSTTGTTASDGTALVSNSTGFTINNREAGSLTLGTNNSTRLYIDSAGNVGIGTTVPAAKLDVIGTISQRVDASIAANQYPLQFFNDYSGTDYYLLRQRVVNGGAQVRTGLGITGAPDAAFVLGPQTDQTIKFSANGRISNLTYIDAADPLRINSGEVRIGDTSGSAVSYLNVIQGTSSTKPALGLKQGVGGSNKMITILNSSGAETMGITSEGGFYFRDNNLVGRFTFEHDYSPAAADGLTVGIDLRTEDASGNLRSVGYIDVTQDDISADESSMRLSVGETTPSEVMRLQSDGNVGIGTTAPVEKLHVDGNIRTSSNTGLGVGTDTIYSNSVNIKNSGQYRIGNAEFISKSANDMNIFQGKMWVASTGNVGIGTTAPSEKLHVAGNAKVDGTLVIDNTKITDTNGQVYIDNLTNGGDLFIRTRDDQGGVDTGILLNGTDKTVSLHYNTLAKLITASDGVSVTGNINLSAGSYLKSSTRTNILLDRPADARMVFNTLYQSSTTGGYEFTTGSTSRMVIAGDGNVGIGTTAPDSKLHVKATSGIAFKVDPNSADKEWYIDTTNPDHLKKEGNLILNADPTNVHTSTKISFNIDGSNKASINSDGDLGVGTTAQTSKVHVDGTAMRQLRIGTAGGPSSNTDTSGAEGDIAYDDLYLYIKTGSGWGRVALDFAF